MVTCCVVNTWLILIFPNIALPLNIAIAGSARGDGETGDLWRWLTESNWGVRDSAISYRLKQQVRSATPRIYLNRQYDATGNFLKIYSL